MIDYLYRWSRKILLFLWRCSHCKLWSLNVLDVSRFRSLHLILITTFRFFSLFIKHYLFIIIVHENLLLLNLSWLNCPPSWLILLCLIALFQIVKPLIRLYLFNLLLKWLLNRSLFIQLRRRVAHCEWWTRRVLSGWWRCNMRKQRF